MQQQEVPVVDIAGAEDFQRILSDISTKPIDLNEFSTGKDINVISEINGSFEMPKAARKKMQRKSKTTENLEIVEGTGADQLQNGEHPDSSPEYGNGVMEPKVRLKKLDQSHLPEDSAVNDSIGKETVVSDSSSSFQSVQQVLLEEIEKNQERSEKSVRKILQKMRDDQKM